MRNTVTLMAIMHPKQARPRVCVFCSTKSGKDGSGPVAARELSQALQQHKIELIYGGGTTGLMGELARERVRLGGIESVIGVIPYALVDREREVAGKVTASKSKLGGMLSALGIKNTPQISTREPLGDDVHDLPPDPDYGRVVGVSSLARRKAVMMDLVTHAGPGSGFVALPGALGSLDEVLEVVTHRQLGVHRLPMVLINVDGFWDGMKTWVKGAYEKGYMGDESRDFIKIVDTPEEAVEYITNYKP